jgi:hypothetical protein
MQRGKECGSEQSIEAPEKELRFWSVRESEQDIHQQDDEYLVSTILNKEKKFN